MAWATAAETLTYTGITVTDAEIEQAQAIVEIFADTTIEASDAGLISSKNLRFLKMAVAYQAAWITEHPDLFTHVDVSTMLQDGLQFVTGHENAFLLAPFTRRSINRLSWKRNRSLRVRRSKRQSSRSIRRIGYMGSIGGYNSSFGGDVTLLGESNWEPE